MGAPPLSSEDFSAAISAMTHAFGDATRREIYLVARASERGVTAAEVAERFDLHPNVARHHLDKLAAGGYLDVELDRQEAVGRPSKRYRAEDVESIVNFPPRRDDLLGALLVRALDLLPPDEATRLAEEVGYEYGAALAARMSPSESHRSVQVAVASVAEALTAHGYAAHSESRGSASLIVAEACPFGLVATEHSHVICSVDRGMIRGMLAALYGDTDPCLEQARPLGDSHCVTRV